MLITVGGLDGLQFGKFLRLAFIYFIYVGE